MPTDTPNFPTSLDTNSSLQETRNNATTTLNGSHSDTDTIITVSSTSSFPATGAITINNTEICYYGSKDSTHFLDVVRGRDSTTVVSHASGVSVELFIVSVHHMIHSLAIIAAETKLGTGSSTPTSGIFLKGTGTGTSAWTAIDAADIQSGTLSVNRLAGITNSQIDNAAAIAWTKISKSGSSLADLATRSATDLTTGTLADARLSSNVAFENTANVFNLVQTIIKNAIAETPTYALSLENNTPSTALVDQQYSPAIKFTGHAWNVEGSPAADTTSYVRTYLVPVVEGGEQHVTWKFQYSFDDSTYLDLIKLNDKTGITANLLSAVANTDFSISIGGGSQLIIYNSLGSTFKDLLWSYSPIGMDLIYYGEYFKIVKGGLADVLIIHGSATDEPVFDLIGNSLTTGPLFSGRVPIGGFTGNLIHITDMAGSPVDKFIVDADGVIVTGTIDYTSILNKSVVNVDVSASAAIAYSKLSLGNSILNADINSSAAIANSKLANSSITITGVTNQISISGSPVSLGGSVVIGTSQDIGTSSSPTFSSLTLASTGASIFSSRSQIKSSADSKLTLLNNAGNNFDMLLFGGTSSAFPAIKRESATIWFRLADDSDYCSAYAYSFVGVSSVITNFFNIGTAGGDDVRIDASGIAQKAAAYFQWSSTSASGGSSDLRLIRSAAGILALTNPAVAGAALEFTEMSTPSAPAANKARFFIRDDGGGATEAVMLFSDSSEIIVGASSIVTSFNGLTASTQTFVDDTNVTITSVSSTHTLGWSGQLAISRGGTGQSTQTAAFDALSPTTTRGDLIVNDGTNDVRLALGSSARYLRSDGTDALWAILSASDLGSGTVPLARLSAITTTELSATAGIVVGQGGTGTTTFTSNGVLYGNSTSAIQVTSQGAANSILTANAGAPSFSQTPTINTSIQVGVVSTQTGLLKLANSSTTNLTSIRAGNATNALIFTLPTNDPSAGQFLKAAAPSSGDVILSWSDTPTEQILVNGFILDVNTTSLQDAYTVPIGKTLVLTRIILRSPSTDLTTLSASFRTVNEETSSNLTNADIAAYFTSSAVYKQIIYTDTSANIATGELINSGFKVQLKVNSAFGSAATLKVDLFGYLI
jgi:hypothetical protein